MHMVWQDWAGDAKTNAHGMARLGLRWKSERAWYGENGPEIEKRTRMVWRDWAGDGETNAHGMARLGRRWKNECARYDDIEPEMENMVKLLITFSNFCSEPLDNKIHLIWQLLHQS